LEQNSGTRNVANRFSLKLLIAVLLLSLSVTMMSACSRETELQKQSYRQDGFQGYSNSNPNLINRHSTLSYQQSIDFIHELLAPLQGIKKQELKFVGSKIYLKLRVDKAMSEENKRKLQNDTQSTLKMNFPEYDVHVSVENS